jgi:hypothetical protein
MPRHSGGSSHQTGRKGGNKRRQRKGNALSRARGKKGQKGSKYALKVARREGNSNAS